MEHSVAETPTAQPRKDADRIVIGKLLRVAKRSIFQTEPVNTDEIIAQLRSKGIRCDDLRLVDKTVVIFEPDNMITLKDGRMTEERTIGGKQRYDGSPADYLIKYSPEIADKKVTMVRVSDSYLPNGSTAGIENAQREWILAPNVPGEFYESRRRFYDHAKSAWKDWETNPPPTKQ